MSAIFRALVLRVVNFTNHPRYCCCFTRMDSDYDNKDHCIDKPVKHLKCCHSKSAFVTSHNDIVSEFFKLAKLYFSPIIDGLGLLRWNIFP